MCLVHAARCTLHTPLQPSGKHSSSVLQGARVQVKSGTVEWAKQTILNLQVLLLKLRCA